MEHSACSVREGGWSVPPEVRAPGILTVFQWRAERVLGGVGLRPDGIAAFIQSLWAFRKHRTRWFVGGRRTTSQQFAARCG